MNTLKTQELIDPTSVKGCGEYITFYCQWQMCHFADRIRKLFEFHFIKSMHDYFDQSQFFHQTYPHFQELINSGVSEKELIENSEETRLRAELKQREQSAAVYHNMLKNMTKLGSKLKLMGNRQTGLYFCIKPVLTYIF